jgi:serine/threonine protein kinase/tetratricopeptide (TPR) repeat protein
MLSPCHGSHLATVQESPTDNNERTLGDFIDAFEEAQVRDGSAELADFLPDESHPLYAAVLRELVRVDLEYGWRRGTPRPLAEYLDLFPRLRDDPQGLRDIEFENKRLREQALESRQKVAVFDTQPGPTIVRPLQGGSDTPVSFEATNLEAAGRAYEEFCRQQQDGRAPGSFGASFRGAVEHVHLFEGVAGDDPEAARLLARAVSSMPLAGTRFLGFKLIEELGRGAFGRVFLAHQDELAGRPVALKISTHLDAESRSLAQLQHTNIVPIYSIHHAPPFQAVCMPYFGSTTLADVLRDLNSCAVLPESGKRLVSTLHERKQRTLGNKSARPASSIVGAPSLEEPAAPLEPPPEATSPGLGRAVLEMLEGYTYVQSVLWIASRLADGLAHAHERGILHRDLKPANILLTDEGQPMLLDFNLSADTKLGTSPEAAMIGGTLIYMSPEHIEAFRGGQRPVDARSDIYALGLILYELLTRRHAHPVKQGPLSEVMPQLLAARQSPPPSLRCWNKSISPAVASIIQHCLEPDPDRRYQSAKELRADLQRQLANRPLRHATDRSPVERAQKWARRHPRLTSTSTVAAVAVVLIALLGGTWGYADHQWTRRTEARQALDRFHDDLFTGQYLLNTGISDPRKRARGIEACQQAASRYRMLDNDAWQELPAVSYLKTDERERLRGESGELLLLWARAALQDVVDHPERADRDEQLQLTSRLNRRAEQCFPADEIPTLLWQQRAGLTVLLDPKADVRDLLEKGSAERLRTARDYYLLAAEHVSNERYRQAISPAREATRRDPANFWAWFTLGLCHDRLAHHGEAIGCFNACTALRPDYGWTYYNRGLVRLRMKHPAEARKDLDRAIELLPAGDAAEPFLNRALAWQDLGEFGKAEGDLTSALKSGASETRIYFLRAMARHRLGDKKGAQDDHDEGMRRQPTDDVSWIARGLERDARDIEGKLADYRKAIELNPRSFHAWQNIANVLSDIPSRIEEAIDAENKAIAIAPDFVMARSGRGVLLARKGQRAAALEDAQEALLISNDADIKYQVAGIYALTSKQDPEDRLRAYQLLSSALRQGFGLDLVDIDPELDPIRKEPEFLRLLQSARALRTGEQASK